MTDTANLALPIIDAAQAQKHVTHNEALRILDTLVQLAVVTRSLGAPPSSPSEGQRWIVQASPAPTGGWSGRGDQIAAWQDGAWQFSAAKTGWVAFVVDEGALLVWAGSAWIDFTSTIAALQNLALLGIGTTADAGNPFSAKLNNALWVAKTVGEGGSGDLRYKLSKATAGNVLSLLFQDNFSGRAEIGLTGDDNFRFKTSPDGSTWIDSLILDGASGSVDLYEAESSLASAATTDLGSVNTMKVVVTGTTTITSFGTAANRLRLIRFAGALTLTHNATSLILPGAANIATAAGDCAVAASDGSGNWRVRHYQRATGAALVEHGRCRLVKSGANIVLQPYNGNTLIIDGGRAVIPSTGVSLAPTGLIPTTTQRSRTSNVATLTLAAPHELLVNEKINVTSMGDSSYNGLVVLTAVTSTTISYASTGADEATTADTAGRVECDRYIYAYFSSGALALEARGRSIGHSTDATTGVEVASSDNSRTFVGIARITTGPAWVDTGQQRFVRSYFNRPALNAAITFGTARSTTSSGYNETNAADRLEFVLFADEWVGAYLNSWVTNTGNNTNYLGIGFDGTYRNGMVLVGTSLQGGVQMGDTNRGGEAYHYFSPLFGCAAGTVTLNASGYTSMRAYIV